ncbi:MAG: InlB B-repeat-containing protein [Oscillospiraceae bacterium]|nr:InlB B-repeat-containing protein [Oscillospiraceae bacterium]
MAKRLLCVVITVVMVFTALSVASFAAIIQNVCQIGNTYYSSLQAAFDAAEDGDTIYWILGGSSISTSSSYTITLSGNKSVTLNFDGDEYKFAQNVSIAVESGCSLTLTNGTVSGSSVTSGALIYVSEGASLTVDESATLKVSNSGAYAIYNEGTVTIDENATVTNSSSLGYAVYNDGTLTADESVEVCSASGSYNLIYNANNGTGAIVAIAYESGEAATVASGDSLSYEGYTFSGWNTASDGSGTTYAVGDSITISEDTTLYAVWTAELDDTWVEYTNMRNGYDLAIGFYIPKDKLDDTYTVKITANVATYSSGWVKTSTVTEIDSADWDEDTVDGTEYWVVIYEGIWAMQYAEDITIDIYDEDGNAVCESYTDSISAYEARYITKYSEDSNAVALANALLSYCSAAKTYYGY